MTSELLSTGEGRLLQPEEYLAEGVIILRTIQKGVRAIQNPEDEGLQGGHSRQALHH